MYSVVRHVLRRGVLRNHCALDPLFQMVGSYSVPAGSRSSALRKGFLGRRLSLHVTVSSLGLILPAARHRSCRDHARCVFMLHHRPLLSAPASGFFDPVPRYACAPCSNCAPCMCVRRPPIFFADPSSCRARQTAAQSQHPCWTCSPTPACALAVALVSLMSATALARCGSCGGNCEEFLRPAAPALPFAPLQCSLRRLALRLVDLRRSLPCNASASPAPARVGLLLCRVPPCLLALAAERRSIDQDRHSSARTRPA